MLRLTLIHHGDLADNQPRRYWGHHNTPLSALGRQQAAALAPVLADAALAAVYTSDLGRAQQTAALAAPHLTATPAPALREMAFGVFEGLTYAQTLTQYPALAQAWHADPDQPPTGGERLQVFAVRVQRFIAEVRTLHAMDGACAVDGQMPHVLIFAHGGTIRMILCAALNLPYTRQWQFQIDHASRTALEWYDAGAILTAVNDTAHLRDIVKA
jgi:alpha-ribazole phosphatase